MKPLKMGIRVCNLIQSWDTFVEKYDQLTKAQQLLYRLELTPEERQKDLDDFKMLRDLLIKHNLVQDTVIKLNKEIKLGKRVLAEDCSS